MITVTKKVQFTRRAPRRPLPATDIAAAPTSSTGRVPRVSRLMALAIRFDRLIREGQAYGQSELARLGHISQPRMTQIMNLNHLAPDIQEELLFLPLVAEGRDRIHEKMLRPVAAELDWRVQRQRWAHLQLVATKSVD